MTQHCFEIRTMSSDDVEFALELAGREGWNPGLEDAGSFHRTDPGGFFLGVLDGRPIGCISAVSYGGTFGFIGLYIVVPEHRGQGYGMRLWNAALHQLQGQLIGLDGVVEQQPNYRRSGFELAYRNIRYQGQAVDGQGCADGLVELGTVDFEALLAYDRPLFPADRERFLRNWLVMPNAWGWAYLRGKTIAGYGVIRRCRFGYKIGPLFADDAAIAEALFTGLQGYAEPGAAVYLDLPEPNAAALELVHRHGMAKVFETARMYTGAAPCVDLGRIFGITTFELG